MVEVRFFYVDQQDPVQTQEAQVQDRGTTPAPGLNHALIKNPTWPCLMSTCLAQRLTKNQKCPRDNTLVQADLHVYSSPRTASGEGKMVLPGRGGRFPHAQGGWIPIPTPAIKPKVICLTPTHKHTQWGARGIFLKADVQLDSAKTLQSGRMPGSLHA